MSYSRPVETPRPAPQSPLALGEGRVEFGTPEDVAVGFPLAGLGNRIVAAALDYLVTALVSILLLVALVFVSVSYSAAARTSLADLFRPDGEGAQAFLTILAAYQVLVFLVQWGYFVFAEMVWNGASPGKRLLGLRVIRDGGYPITFTSSVLRNLGRIADLLPGTGLVALVAMFFNRDEKRLGDVLAGTVVVRESREDAAFEPFEGQRHSALSERRFAFNRAALSSLGPEHLQVLRSWYRRAPSLPPAAADRLRARLADAFARRTLPADRWPVDDGERDALLRELLLALRERLEIEA